MNFFNKLRQLLIAIESFLVKGVEWCAAALVFADVCILLLGVVSRFVFRQPLTWSDELASMVFLWSAMLGSVVAVKRAEHMRMTALISLCRGGVASFFEALQYCAGLAFLGLLFVFESFFCAHEVKHNITAQTTVGKTDLSCMFFFLSVV